MARRSFTASIRAWVAAVRITGAPAAHWTPSPPLLRLDCMVSQSVCPPAPLDPSTVAQSLRPFGESRMLPRAAYVDPAVFAWERRHMFGGGWMCVGRSGQVASPGDMRAEAVRAGSGL